MKTKINIVQQSEEFLVILLIPIVIVMNVALGLRYLESVLTQPVYAANEEVYIQMETPSEIIKKGYISKDEWVSEVSQGPQLPKEEKVLGVSTEKTPYKAMRTSQNYELVNIAPNGRFTFEVFFKNLGTTTWTKDGEENIYLTVKDGSTRFQDPYWLTKDTPAKLYEDEVKSGEVGKFVFALSAPSENGEYSENFFLTNKGGEKISGSDLKVTYNVGVFNFHFQAEKTYQNYENVNIESQRGFTFEVKFLNKGPWIWEQEGENQISLMTNNPNNSVSPFRHQYWIDDYVVAKLQEEVVKPGEIATFRFALQAPLKSGVYEENFFLRNETLGFVNGGRVKVQINVKENVSDINQDQPDLLIGLYNTKEPVEVSVDSAYSIKDGSGKVLDILDGQTVSSIIFTGSEYEVNTPNKKSTSKDFIIIESTDSNALITLENYDNGVSWDSSRNDNQFRGKIHIQYNEDTEKLWVINNIPIELYLRGLAEAGNNNDIDYLKALVIAARTYAYFQFTYPTKYAHEDFLMSATAADQVYRGYGHEELTPNITKAVQETEGMIVIYDNEIALTPYFSRSDGKTRSSEEVWGSNRPWLVAVEDPYCEDMELWGHGVGMSATGAMYYASEDGWSYEQILKHYYTGIELREEY